VGRRSDYCAVVLASAISLLGGTLAFAAAAPPDLTKATPARTDNSYNLGPTGALGWMYVEAGMTVKSRQILITAVEKGSPADGVLEVGDVILGVFGKPFTEDARRSFGRAIGEAETEKGKGLLPLIVWRKGKTQNIDLKIQVMGAYSDTSPYDCPKAKKILEQGCALIAKDIKRENRFWINELALMASGKPEYQELVRQSAQAVAAATPETEELWAAVNHGGMHTWELGYKNVFLTEYYLVTGDKTVLPAIRACTGCIARGQGKYGTWGHGLIGPGPGGQRIHHHGVPGRPETVWRCGQIRAARAEETGGRTALDEATARQNHGGHCRGRERQEPAQADQPERLPGQ